jgi:hypothetical protein
MSEAYLDRRRRTDGESYDSLMYMPTKEQRDFKAGIISEIPVKQYYTYWTNFSREFPENFVVYVDKIVQKLTPEEKISWWKFTTNIEPQQFDYEWDTNRVRRFLFAMDDLYNRRQIQTK